MDVPEQAHPDRVNVPLNAAFDFIQAFNGSNGSCPHWGEQSALRGSPMQILISSSQTHPE